MRVLVTGGAGFIGSHVVDALVEAGHEVRVLDLLHPAAHNGPPSYLHPAADYVLGSLEDTDLVGRCVRDVDAVSHQAAMVGLGVDLGDVPAYVRHNDLGTAVMLQALAQSGFGGRLVLASSMVVYGEGRYRCEQHGLVAVGPRDETLLRSGRFEPICDTCGNTLVPEPVPESAPPDPRNVYAATKVHQEHLCQAFARETGLPFVALRYHNVYGPRMPRNTPYAGVASIFRTALERDEAPELFEDGRQLRDFIHVRDVAMANMAALTMEPPARGAFNVASGDPHTVGQMAEALTVAFGPDAPRPKTTGRYRLGDVRHVFASIRRAEEALRFRATIRFDEGMREFAGASLRDPIDSSQI
jgi:dTDP-L-rhamnose 4-epimerase